MSRVGKTPIDVPQGVEVAVSGAQVKVKGPKGQLQVDIIQEHLDVSLEDGQITVGRKSEEKYARSLHGLTRSLIANAVSGVSSGFSKRLDVYGVGYRVEVQGKRLTLHLGFSHPVVYDIPEGVEITTENAVQGSQARLVISGIDKQQVGQTAAEIRSKRKPDPYKGKGVRYEDEVIHWKQGKSAVG